MKKGYADCDPLKGQLKIKLGAAAGTHACILLGGHAKISIFSKLCTLKEEHI